MVKLDIALHHNLNISCVEDAVVRSAEALGMFVSSKTNLAKYQDSLHWHLRRRTSSGTLEVTVIKTPRQLWVSYHDNRVGDGWVREAAQQLATALAEQCS